MKKYVYCAIAVLVLVVPGTLSACVDCDEYFDYQALDWCAYCSEGRDCGYETCHLEQWGSQDVCAMQGRGCNAYGRRLCPAEPVAERALPAETWRLAKVQTFGPKRTGKKG